MFRRGHRPITPDERTVDDRERARERTMNRAVKLLAAKPRSVRELRDRLLEKRWTDEQIVDDVLARLKDYDYLNDEQFARDAALSKLRQKPIGRRRLEQAMSQKKLDSQLVDTAISEAYEKLPEEELITLVIEKRLRLKGLPTTREETRKFYDYLLRQGFGYDLIREKMAAVASRLADDE